MGDDGGVVVLLLLQLGVVDFGGGGVFYQIVDWYCVVIRQLLCQIFDGDGDIGFDFGLCDFVLMWLQQYCWFDLLFLLGFVDLVWVGYFGVKDCLCDWNQIGMCDLVVVKVYVDFVQFVGVDLCKGCFIGFGIVVDWDCC